MKPFDWKIATTATQAFTDKKKAVSHYIAGGTNQADLMKRYVHNPDVLVDINALLANTVEETGSGIRIGAGVKNSDLANQAIIKEKYPLLSKAILAGASPQIRNMASTGGNLLQRTRCPYFYDTAAPCNKRNPGSGCSAINGDNHIAAIFGTSPQCIAVHPSDMCIALAALDAVVIVQTERSEQKIPFTNCHRMPGATPEKDNNLPENAIITAIEIPQNNFSANGSYLKVRDRDSYAFALVSVAAALELSGNNIKEARLAAGGVAHKPWRFTAVENYLRNKPATAATFKEAGRLAIAGAKTFGGNDYKIPMLQAAVETALLQSMNA